MHKRMGYLQCRMSHCNGGDLPTVNHQFLNVKKNTLLTLLRARPSATPAIVHQDKVITVGELLTQSEQLAAGLQRLGIRRDDTAVLAAMPDAGFISIVYAAMICGLRLAVIDPEMGRDNYREKLRQLQPGWAFVDARLLLLQEHPLLRRAYFRWSRKGIYFPKAPDVRIIATGPWLPLWQKHVRLKNLAVDAVPLIASESLTAEAEFLITYTSGTTSLPKGVVHSIGAITAGILQIAELIRGGHNRRIATHLPYFALIGLNAGVAAHLWDYASSAQEKLQFIEEHNITTLFSPPCDYLPLLEICEREGRRFPACLQHLFFGSAPVYRSFLERLLPVLPDHVRLTCLYGMTENLVVAAIDGREKAWLPTDSGDVVGKPVAGVELRFADDGEILLRSPQTFTRYLHLAGRDEWHASGDLGHLDAQGRLVLTGRKKDMIIRRNFNLYPGLYEPTVNRIPGVTECAFVGRFDEKKQDESVVLFVENHRPITASAVRRALAFGTYSIDREALPDLIIFSKLPRAGRQNKVDKAALRARLVQ